LVIFCNNLLCGQDLLIHYKVAAINQLPSPFCLNS